MGKALLRNLVGVLSIFVLAVSSLAAFVPAQKVSADFPGGDCDSNAVIRCGVNSVGELKNDYRANQGGNVQAIFRHFHMNNEAAFDGMVRGRVTKTNEVWVGNKRVATGAVTAGRQFMPGSTKIPGINAWMRNPAVSFRSNSLDAFVKMDGETFRYAVIMSCGNPVNAFPIVKPKPTPKPKPKPKPQPKPQPKKPELEIQKDVRIPGETEFQQEVTADADGELQYRITVKNTGETDLKNLRIQDSLPNGVSFEDANLEGSEAVREFMISDLVGEGIVIESLEKGGLIEIRFAVTVGSETDACEEPLRNVAFAEADDVPEEEDDASARVCLPERPEQPHVKARQTPPAPKLPDTGAAGALGIFSVTSILGFVTYKLKELYSIFLR